MKPPLTPPHEIGHDLGVLQEDGGVHHPVGPCRYRERLAQFYPVLGEGHVAGPVPRQPEPTSDDIALPEGLPVVCKHFIVRLLAGAAKAVPVRVATQLQGRLRARPTDPAETRVLDGDREVVGTGTRDTRMGARTGPALGVPGLGPQSVGRHREGGVAVGGGPLDRAEVERGFRFRRGGSGSGGGGGGLGDLGGADIVASADFVGELHEGETEGAGFAGAGLGGGEDVPPPRMRGTLSAWMGVGRIQSRSITPCTSSGMSPISSKDMLKVFEYICRL